MDKNVETKEIFGYRGEKWMDSRNNMVLDRYGHVTFISRECRINGFPPHSYEGALECKRIGINNIRVSVRHTADDVFVLSHDETISNEARNPDGSIIGGGGIDHRKHN